MPDIQLPEYQSLLRRRLGIRGVGVGNMISPEIVPVLILDTVLRAREAGAMGHVGVAAGGAGLRSEIQVTVRAGAVDARDAVWIHRIVYYGTAAIQLQLLNRITPSGFSDSYPGYGDSALGLAPLSVGGKNTAAATSGGVDVLGNGLINIANVPVEIFPNLYLRDRTDPVNQRSLILRPSADNTALGSVIFEWEIVGDVP